MEDALARPRKSTTVRTIVTPAGRRRPQQPAAQLRWLRRAFRALGPHAPELSAAVAERLFLTPPPFRPEPDELDAMLLADAVEVPAGLGVLRGWSFGEGPAVLLVHGWGGRGAQLRGFIEPLVSRGRRVVLFDAPGHGARGTGTSSLPQIGAAVAAMLAAIGPVAGVIAHSMGGPATALALERSRLRPRLAFIAPPAELKNATRRFGRALAIPERVVDRLEQRIEHRFLRKVGDYDLTAHPALGLSPLLVVHDATDREVPLAEGERVARANGASLHVTHGLGHVRILRDKEVIERVASFVTADDA